MITSLNTSLVGANLAGKNDLISARGRNCAVFDFPEGQWRLVGSHYENKNQLTRVTVRRPAASNTASRRRLPVVNSLVKFRLFFTGVATGPRRPSQDGLVWRFAREPPSTVLECVYTHCIV
jgi:hypothetical protein